MGLLNRTLFDPPAEPYLGDSGSRLAVGEETFDRRLVSTAAITTNSSGALRLTYWTARKTETITQTRIRTSGTAAGATPTLCRIGVWREEANGDLTPVAAIDNDTTLFAASGSPYTKAFTSSWTKRRGQRYAYGLLVVSAAALPTFYGIPGALTTGMPSDEAALAPRLNASLSGQTDLPTTITAGSLALSGTGLLYAALLP